MKRTIRTRSPEETRELGKQIGAELNRGELIALHGKLGTGKTQFVQGLAAGLGIKEAVLSPTFVFVKEARGRLPLAHVDLYRTHRPEDILELNVLEYLDEDWVVAVEWAEKGEPLFPRRRLDIRFSDEGETTRRIELETGEAELDPLLKKIHGFQSNSADNGTKT
ncbi:MAG TPA: tRNA (adenosine(37)-N6)-threonylcarbamoyltransferase complex ATPase subunit type 1 TsaE [Nitrospiria bacterium]